MKNAFTYSIRKLPACLELDGTPVAECFNVIATDSHGNRWDAGEHPTRAAAQAWIDLRQPKVPVGPISELFNPIERY